jgi:PhnB protein
MPNTTHELFPYLCVSDTDAAVRFYQQAFGGEELFRLVEPSGRIGHAEVKIGPAIVMLCDPFPEYGIDAPQANRPISCTIHLHVDNADEMGARAVEAGATMTMPPTDQFYGERSCRLRDPFGHSWLIGHSIEKVTPEEMQRRYTAMMQA